MEHHFIINAFAGKRTATAQVEEMAAQLAQRHGLDVTCHVTPSANETVALVRDIVAKEVPVRFYACGGDGTIHYVIAGMAGCDHAAVTMLPVGTGNDLLRNFGDKAPLFQDPENLWDGPEFPLDLIDCNGHLCLTIACFGVDARVAADVHTFSKLPLVNNRGGYLLSVARNAFRPIGRRWTVVLDGEAQERHLALVATCNGRYYGGGSCPIPQARMDDGKLETILVDNMSIFKFGKLFPIYSAGDHHKMSQYAKVHQVEKLEIRSKVPDITVCLDGEIMHRNHVTVQCSRKKVNFFTPQGADPNATSKPW